MNPATRAAQTVTTLASNRSLLMAMAGAWMLTAMAALIITGAARMSASPHALDLALQCIGGSAPLIIGGLLICRLTLRKVWSKGLLAVFTLLATLMCVGITLNLQGWCGESDLWHPAFQSNTDSSYIWFSTLAHYGIGSYTSPHNTGVPILLTFLLRIFGGGVLTTVIFSAMCILLATASAAATCVRLLPGVAPRKAALAGALLFAVIPSMAWYGTLLMKEAPAIFGFALCTYTLACALRRHLSAGAIFSGALGSLLLMLVKSPLGWFLLLGAVAAGLTIFMELRKKRTVGTSPFNGILYVALLCAAIIIGGRNFRFTNDTELFNARTSTAYAPDADKHVETTEQIMMGYESVRPYAEIIGKYYSTPLSSRLARLPLTAVAMYFPPFPWHFMRDTDLSRFVPWAHLPLWYPVGGSILAYFALCLWSKKRRGLLPLWSAWVIVCWCAIALASAGSVARYWLPLVPAMIPLGLQALVCMKRGVITRRITSFYWGTYALLLVTALFLSYHFLH